MTPTCYFDAVEISCSVAILKDFVSNFLSRVYFLFRPSFFDTMDEGVSELYMNISSDGDCDFDEADTCQMIGVSSQARIRRMSHDYDQRPSCRGGWRRRRLTRKTNRVNSRLILTRTR